MAIEQLTAAGEQASSVITVISDNLWYIALVIILITSIFFTIRGKCIQVSRIKETLHIFKENIAERSHSNSKSISAFRSFCTTMGNRVGIGNIAGVAMAIVMGGPGAIFWMCIFVFLLASFHLSNQHSARSTKRR